jgi:hypothetical protein
MRTEFPFLCRNHSADHIMREVGEPRPVSRSAIAIEQHRQRGGHGHEGICYCKQYAPQDEIEQPLKDKAKETGGKRALLFDHAQQLAQRHPPVIHFYECD